MFHIEWLIIITLFLFGQNIYITQTCSVSRLTTPQELITQAYIIVRVKAIDYDDRTDYNSELHTNGIPNSIIRFEVEEVLKGTKLKVPNPLLINGYLSQDDGFNNGLVPYKISGRLGSSGSCYGYSYKKNGRFLLVLNDEYTPYHTPFAPVHEQLHLPVSDDKWLLWVKEQVGSNNSDLVAEKLFITSRANKLRLFF